VRRNDLDGFDGGGVAAEHRDEHVVYDFDFCLVESGDFDEDVFGVEGDLAVVTIDDRGKREYCAVGIVDNGVDGRIANDVEITTEVLVFL